MSILKLYSWNVAGFRAVLDKEIQTKDKTYANYMDWMQSVQADIYCLQETKSLRTDLPTDVLRPTDYSSYFHPAQKKGYSGVAAYVSKNMDIKRKITSLSDDPDDFMDTSTQIYDQEGRFLRLDFEEFTLMTLYFPNGGRGGPRLIYKERFHDYFLQYCNKLKAEGKKLIVCGDVNIAHTSQDLARPEQNEKHSGFLPQERKWMDKFLESGFIDSFRYFHPDKKEMYTYWDNRTFARQTNTGWRIDYFLVDKALEDNMQAADIHMDIMGSDHCPISLTLKL